jgi:hypothetical protein
MFSINVVKSGGMHWTGLAEVLLGVKSVIPQSKTLFSRRVNRHLTCVVESWSSPGL